jgi:uncharacterized damage-inducible protein DinB
MPPRTAAPTSNLSQEIAQAFLVNDQMNQLLLQHLDPRAWRAKPPGQNVRTIADIFAHVHNIRCKWLRLSAHHLKLPALLNRHRCTQKQAQAALVESALRCSEMLAEALSVPSWASTEFFARWRARPWRPGTAMFAYTISHHAHHRGQACMLAHQLGFRLPKAAGCTMWYWEKLWKQCGFELATAPKTRRS